MKKKTFTINHIQSNDELNALSLSLNSIEQVSHLKIGKESVTFDCVDIDLLVDTISDINENFKVEQVINGQSRSYDFDRPRNKDYYFMFREVISEDDIYTFSKVIEEDERFSNVKYDGTNKVLTLTSDLKDVLGALKEELAKLNPSIEIYEYKRPIRSNEKFKQLYLRNYAKVGLLLFFIAMAIVTRIDSPIVSKLCYIAFILVLGEQTVKSAIKNITHKHGLHEDVLVIAGLILGVLSGHPIESIVALVLYMALEPYKLKMLRRSFAKINDVMDKPETATRVIDYKKEVIPLNEFQEGDVMLISDNEVIPLHGYIIEGESIIDTYANTSSYDLKAAKIGDAVNSGDINLKGTIKVRVRGKYENSNLNHILNIASNSPIYTSRIEKVMQRISFWYTPIVVILALIIGVILPIINYEDFGLYMSVGAILLLVSGSFSTDQSASIGMLAGFASAYRNGILIESASGMDALNTAQYLIYDTIDDSDIKEDELDLMDSLNHLGRIFIIFNDSRVRLEDTKFRVYNDIKQEEKIEIMNNIDGKIAYVGDSYKDIECFQKSDVAISRGGINNSHIVENSDVILMDNDVNKILYAFKIARNTRSRSIINLFISLTSKLVLMILAFSLIYLPLYITILVEAIVTAISLMIATGIINKDFS